MTAAAAEPLEGYLPLPPEGVRDDLSLRIVRTPRKPDEAMPGHEARWVERCRRIGTAALRRWNMTRLVEDAQLLTSELVTNALQHGDGSGDIVVRFVILPDRMLIGVDDGSPSKAHVRQTGADDEAGRGLLLVAALATEWGVSPDGTTTWCSLARDGRA